jgi:DNA phosphorothioation system restriction enzyme
VSLKSLTLSKTYRSDYRSISKDLYPKCLRSSTTYYRAVGFFSSSVFQTCTDAFASFFESGGRIQLVSSCVLSHADAAAIRRGYADRHNVVSSGNKIHLLRDRSTIPSNKLANVVAWLVATGKLDIKIAVTERASAIYHEKIGCFFDSTGAFIAFSGSANESAAALEHNFEQVDLSRSWRRREIMNAEHIKRNFELLWKDSTPHLDVLSFPEATRQGALSVRDYGGTESKIRLPLQDSDTHYSMPDIEPVGETLAIPSEIDLYDHQKEGVREWLAGRARGILEMATGSGKTITALSCAAKLYEVVGPPLFIVIVCPYLHLVDQWVDEAKSFGLRPLPCCRGRAKWYEDMQVKAFNSSSSNISSAIVTNSTFASTAFQKSLKAIRSPLLLIADEVHNLGSENYRRALPSDANYRLGLSATPERWFDSTGTEKLTDYFGPTLVHYTLREALNDKVLCPYHYTPHIVELTDDEVDKYASLTTRIAQAFASSDSSIEEPSARLKSLLIKRARLVATAENKLDKLRNLMRPRRDSTHNLVYCGDGRVESPESEIEIRQLEAVTRVLGNELLMRVAKYAAETPAARRKELRDSFADGTIQCLVAIRCLDEGVDIPETKTAFILASSSNPRQFIQRRGRVLRRAPGKDLAKIHDFIVAPPKEFRTPSSDYYQPTRKLVKHEMRRVVEFAGLAENGPEAMGKLLPIRSDLNLLDIDS